MRRGNRTPRTIDARYVGAFRGPEHKAENRKAGETGRGTNKMCEHVTLCDLCLPTPRHRGLTRALEAAT